MGAALHAARCVGNEVLPMGIFSSLRLWGSLAGLEQQIFEENQDLTLDGRAQAAIGLIACAHLRLSAQCVAVLAGGAADGTPASPAGRAAGARRAVGAGGGAAHRRARIVRFGLGAFGAQFTLLPWPSCGTCQNCTMCLGQPHFLPVLASQGHAASQEWGAHVQRFHEAGQKKSRSRRLFHWRCLGFLSFHPIGGAQERTRTSTELPAST